MDVTLSYESELSYQAGEEELVKKTILYLKHHNKISTPFLMRKLRISYAKACFLMKKVEEMDES